MSVIEFYESDVLVVDQHVTDRAALYCGDSVDVVKGFRESSIGLTVTSVPFPGMYAYTNSARDIGNVKDIAQMIEQTRYLMGPQGLLRATMPGRLCAIHLSQTMAHKYRDGYIGIRDFRGQMIQLMQDEGWIFAGESTIDKDAQVKASRTKEQALLYKTLATDSTKCRPTLADYIVLFRKPGENPVPVKAAIHEGYNPGGGWIAIEEWNEWAGPIWHRQRPGIPHGIKETDVLNVRQARETDDERHLCPLQLGVIDRLIKLYSAPGDTVYDPFGGIGSVPYIAVKLGRNGAASELKRSYFNSAVENVKTAEAYQSQPSLLDLLAATA
ncbi:MAG TPA: DNA methyltransferase [Chloroflexota bacterium]|nr:DNA methyltransferase [Chloroflexota bacterium]